MEEKNFRFETLQVHAGKITDGSTNSMAVPIHQTVAYEFKSSEQAANLFALKEFGNIYIRLQNPTTDVLEKRVAALEGGKAALAVASGHSAQMIALTNIMQNGDNFVASPYLYGGSFNQFNTGFRRFGIECRIANGLNPIDFEMLIDHNTKAIYVETIGNPSQAVPDFEGLAGLAKRYRIPLIVDNTCGAGGYICRPIEHGADIVVESATKWLGGHGTSMGGIIVDAGNFDWGNGKFPLISEPNESYHGMNFHETFGALAFIIRCRVEGLRDLGPAISPFNSFMLIEGIETLSLRVEREAANAMTLAKYFNSHAKVESVQYPGLEDSEWNENAKKYLRNGFGCVLSVVLKGTKEETTTFVESLKLVTHASNLGDNKTLIVQPAATTHSQLSPEALADAGVEPTSLRISVGIEHIDDIIADFEQAFALMNA